MKTTPSLRAIAAAVCVLAMPLSVQAQASLPASAAAAAAVSQPSAAAALKRYELQTNIVDGKMVFIDAKGQVNPVLTAKVGDMVELVLKSGEGAEHDLLIPELNVASSKFSANRGSTTVRFKVTHAGTFTYYCSIPGHRQIGMEGKLVVAGTSLAEAGAPKAAAAGSAAGESSQAAALALYTPAPSPMRGPDPSAVSVAANPAQVPAAIGARAAVAQVPHGDGGIAGQAR